MYEFLRAILALAFVLGLIGLAAFLSKKYMQGGQIPRLSNKKKRLSIEEIQAVDGKRRLVLIKRDNIEHLLMLGADSELLIETIDKTQHTKKNQ